MEAQNTEDLCWKDHQKYQKIGKLAKEMGKGRMKLKKRAVLSGLLAHEELVRE